MNTFSVDMENFDTVDAVRSDILLHPSAAGRHTTAVQSIRRRIVLVKQCGKYSFDNIHKLISCTKRVVKLEDYMDISLFCIGTQMWTLWHYQMRYGTLLMVLLTQIP